MSADTDAQLVAAIGGGEEWAATEFDLRFRLRVEAIVRKRGVAPADCPDVAQEVMANALNQITKGRFRGDSALSTWLHTLTNGKITDYWRKQGRRVRTMSLELLPHVDTCLEATTPDQLRLEVEQALSRLSAADRFLLLFHEREGYTLKEVGQMLGLGKSVMSERLQIARERFREALNATGTNQPRKRLRD